MAGSAQEILWVLQAQSGDREALNRLLGAVEEPLRGYLSRLLGHRELAEDTLQDVFTIIYRKLGWLQEPAMFRPWAFRIASREAFRRLKRERRWSDQVRDPEVLEGVAAESGPLPAFDPEELARLVAEVSPASRAVLVLHYYHEMTLVEIAEVLGIATGTVKSRLAYGLQCLRRAVADHGRLNGT